jgi:hypothetical protein
MLAVAKGALTSARNITRITRKELKKTRCLRSGDIKAKTRGDVP